MRKLKTRDVLAFCHCMKQTGLKDKLGDLLNQAGSGASTAALGAQLVRAVFDAASEPGADEHLYAFLAPIFEMTPGEIADLDIPDFVQLIKQMAAENNMQHFFTSAAELMR